MDQEIKRQWVEALRSGRYLQGDSQLRRIEDGVTLHCCLGVLCELAALAGQGHWDGETTFVDTENNLHGLGLPHTVMRWAGLSDAFPAVKLPGEEKATTLDVLNDGISVAKHDFNGIAALIEEQL